MGIFSDTWRAAAAEGEAGGLIGPELAQYIRIAVEKVCGPLPIKVAAGYVTDISNMTDGRPILRLN